MSESALRRRVRMRCDELGYWAIPYPGSSMGITGFPDLIILKRGQVIFLELKDLGKKPRPIQMAILSKLRALGFTAEWADNYDDAMEVIGVEEAE
jgi:hypothetical protein